MNEAFESDEGDWFTGEDVDYYTEGKLEIVNGVLRVEHEALHSFIESIPAPSDSITDFYISVEVGMLSGTGTAYQGLYFRDSEDGSYFFTVWENQTYDFYRLAPDDIWVPIIKPVMDSVIRPGRVNRIAVLAQGGQFTFFVNGKLVNSAFDRKLGSGKVGITAGVWAVGRDAVWEFDNFIILTPE
jgi:hypothetical protein